MQLAAERDSDATRHERCNISISLRPLRQVRARTSVTLGSRNVRSHACLWPTQMTIVYDNTARRISTFNLTLHFPLPSQFLPPRRSVNSCPTSSCHCLSCLQTESSQKTHKRGPLNRKCVNSAHRLMPVRLAAVCFITEHPRSSNPSGRRLTGNNRL